MLDLAIFFQNWRTGVGKATGQIVPYAELPDWCKLVYNKLKHHGTDQASIDLYINSYFQDAFKVSVLLDGWRL